MWKDLNQLLISGEGENINGSQSWIVDEAIEWFDCMTGRIYKFMQRSLPGGAFV